MRSRKDEIKKGWDQESVGSRNGEIKKWWDQERVRLRRDKRKSPVDPDTASYKPSTQEKGDQALHRMGGLWVLTVATV